MIKKYIFVVLAFLVTLWACSDGEENISDIPQQIDTAEVFESIKTVYYSLPSPMEIAIITKKYSKNFNSEIIHSTAEVMNYVTLEAQSINLGIYSSDLAFVSMYDQKQYSTELFSALINLANKIEILEGINDTLITDIEGNIENPEEIKFIISKAFFKSDAYLKETGKEIVATNIMLGAWVESFYLLSDIALNTTDTAVIYQLIVDQRLVLDNVLKVLELQKIDNSNIQILYELQIMLNNCVTAEKKDIIDTYTDSLRTKTIINYYYSSKNIKEIYEKIRKIRENFVSLQ